MSTNKTSVCRMAMCLVALLSGCASGPNLQEIRSKIPPGQVYVSHSKYNGTLVYNPSELVSVVTPAAVVTRNTLGTGFVVLSAFVGGNGALSVSKEGMIGSKFADDKGNVLPNPFVMTYADVLQQEVNDWMNKHEESKAKVYFHGIEVINGHTRLIYDALTGKESEDFRLRVSMFVHRSKEKGGSKSFDSDFLSATAHRLDEWRNQDFQLLRAELSVAQQACTTKVVAGMPELLAD
jgi:hypothetical protein